MIARLRPLLLSALLAGAALAAGPAAAAPDPVAGARARWTFAAARGADSPAALEAEWDLAVALTGIDALAEAEVHWRRMIAAAAALPEPDPALSSQLDLQLAMNLVRQGQADEGAALAEAALPVAIGQFGPDDERVGLGQAALATARMLQGRYDLAEAPARAAFEGALRRDGGRRAGPYALLLQQIYLALGRDADARAVMARTEPEGVAWSGRQHTLSALREAGDWPRLADAARRYAADWRADGQPLSLALAQEADLDLVLALNSLSLAGEAADFAEAEAAVARVRAERDGAVDGWTLARALNVEADLYLAWPGHEDLGRAARLKGEALAALEAELGPDHPRALSQRFLYGLLLLEIDPPRAAPVLVAYYEAARAGRVPPDDWAVAAARLSQVLADGGNPAAGYRLAADAATDLRGWAVAPERRDGRAAILRTHAPLFRTQVDLAWRLSETLRLNRDRTD